jgi:HSP20 family protein
MGLFRSKKIQVEHKLLENKPDKGDIPLDVFEKDNILFIVALIPGTEPKDLRLTISGDVFSIKGQRFYNGEFNLQNEQFFCQECFWGNFHRSIVFPVKVNVKRVTASFKDSILTVRLPVVERVRNKPDSVVTVKVS